MSNASQAGEDTSVEESKALALKNTASTEGQLPKAPSHGTGGRLSLSLGRKLSLSAISNGSNVAITSSNPRDDLKNGIFDITIPTLAKGDSAGSESTTGLENRHGDNSNNL